jgi:hypothetical protein
LAAAIATTLLASAPAIVLAQSNIEGYAYGTARAGTEIRIENSATGLTRTATAAQSGSFRTPNVPPGTYTVTYTSSAGTAVSREIVVSIGSGTSVDVETVVVTGRAGRGVQPVDMTKTESVTTLTSEQLEEMPVARDVQQVALLAPGVIQGDGGFVSQSNKPLVSFGGASPGENTYFINGFNVTDFRNFLGGATVPFEFYDQFELRNGGYSAEFGRSLGGVINAVTKHGTNKFEYGATAYWQPDALSSKQPNSYFFDPDSGSYQLRKDNSQDYNAEWQLNIQAGGAIIPNKLFFYGLTVLRTVKDDDAVGTTSYSKTDDDTPFYGAKIDWQIADNHSLEYTYMRDDNSITVEGYGYSSATSQLGTLKSKGFRDDGGSTHILHYSGVLFDNLTLSALYGHGEREQQSGNRDAVTGNPCTVIYDSRGGGLDQTTRCRSPRRRTNGMHSGST